MSREIKFRTWDTEYKEFSEWTNRDPFFSTSNGKMFFWERTRKEDGSYGGDIVMEDTGDRFVLQQYTGLKDSKGKEIYEGDIVKGYCLNNGLQICVIGFDTFGIYYTKIKDYPSEPYENCAILAQEYSEIIGNIFENPELLKQ